MIEVLKSCPFCGSDKVEADGWASTDTHGPACEDCGGSCGSALDTPEQNIAAWNLRTTDRANDEEIARLKSALEEIVNPLAAMQRRAEAEGNKLSGMAWEIARTPSYLQGIAKEALEPSNA